MKIICKLLAMVMAFSIAGCAAGRHQGFKEELLETSTDSDRPAWVSKTFKEFKNGFEFSGGVTDISDYALGVSEARSEAIKNGVVSLQIKVRSEFTRFIEGSNMPPDAVGKWVGDGIAYLSESLYVSGIQQREVYYEKAKSNIEYRPHYNIWVLCSISAEDYLTAKIDAAQRLVNKYQQESNQEARQKAEELLDSLREEQTI